MRNLKYGDKFGNNQHTDGNWGYGSIWNQCVEWGEQNLEKDLYGGTYRGRWAHKTDWEEVARKPGGNPSEDDVTGVKVRHCFEKEEISDYEDWCWEVK